MTETQTVEQPAPVDDNTPRLNAALAAVQEELPRIRKAETGKVSGVSKETGKAFSYEYSYADLAAVSAELLPLLGKNGLAFSCWPGVHDGKFVMRYELLHSSGEQKTGEWPLKGGSPQQVGSEITYARRYCLCAVTGVAPDDDDDAAAAEGAKANQRAEQQAEVDQELQHGRDAVRGAWALQFGPWEANNGKADEMYRTWSKTKGQAGTLGAATSGQLRAFAAYLTNLPTADAGSEPTAEPEGHAADPVESPKLGKKDNALMFVLFEKLGMKDDRQGQLTYLSRTLGREIESRSAVTVADWRAVRNALEYDVELIKANGGELPPEDVSGPAPAAQSAAGDNRVPVGPDTNQEGGQ